MHKAGAAEYAEGMSAAPVPANQARQPDRQVVMVYRTRVAIDAQGRQTPVAPELIGEFPVLSPHGDERRRLARSEVTKRFSFTRMSVATGRKVRGEGHNRGRILLVTITEPETFPEGSGS